MSDATSNVEMAVDLHPHRDGCGLQRTERGWRSMCVCSDAEHRARINTLRDLNAASR